MKWYILAVCSLIVFTLLALTAIDKQHERSCVTPQSRRASGTGGASQKCVT